VLDRAPVSEAVHGPAEGWDRGAIGALIDELWALRSAMVAFEAGVMPRPGAIAPHFAASARNLAHYLALRRTDIRSLQERLAWIGVSSLGRAETHVLANLDKVLGILSRLVDRPWTPHVGDEPVGFNRGRALLERHAADLLGPAPAGRAARIMVTLPVEAATDFGLVRRLVAAGMDIARVNCAHDDAPAWQAMAKNVRRAASAVGRPVRILMDLAGPKLRTGPIAAGPPVIKVRPLRDEYGRVLAPARVTVRPAGAAGVAEEGEPLLAVSRKWFARLKEGQHLDCTDARDAERAFRVARIDGSAAVLETSKTVYLTPATRLRRRRKGKGPRDTGLSGFPHASGNLHLQRGDPLHVVRSGIGRAAREASGRRRAQPASVACTLPAVLAQVRRGERIWFDDGRIGGVVRRASRERLEVEITQARDGGDRLAADKGINLPDTALDLPALSAKDRADLAVAARHADLVGLSFARRAADVAGLLEALRDLGAPELGLVLKIETRRGFENLPELLLAAMAARAAGVMIARGDLAVECGYERLAEVQEEILWLAEAAHLPVIWATQVLESLAKTGRPSRAEITDAAMGERAECVMLNKGAYVVDAIRTLDDILRRMQAHQAKKRPLLRALRSFRTPASRPPRAAADTTFASGERVAVEEGRDGEGSPCHGGGESMGVTAAMLPGPDEEMVTRRDASARVRREPDASHRRATTPPRPGIEAPEGRCRRSAASRR
jgi:pyruvate kinase